MRSRCARGGRSRSGPRWCTRRRRSTSVTARTSSTPPVGTRAEPSASRLPWMAGALVVPYSSDRTWSSRKARFSSTTMISSSPCANSRTISGSSGQTSAGTRNRIPRSARSSVVMPRSPSAVITSVEALPAARIPTRAGPRPWITSRPRVADVVVHRVESRAHRVFFQSDGERRVQPVVEERRPRRPVALVAGHLGEGPAEVDGRVAVGHVGVDLQADPRAAAPRELVPVAAEVEHVLHGGRGQGGHGEVGQGPLGLGRHGGRLALGVVADRGHHTAGGRNAREGRVAQRVARPVEPGGLAVPESDHAVDGARRVALALLGPPDDGRGEVLVDAVDVAHVVGERARLRAPCTWCRRCRAASRGTRRPRPEVRRPRVASARTVSSGARNSAATPLIVTRPLAAPNWSSSRYSPCAVPTVGAVTSPTRGPARARRAGDGSGVCRSHPARAPRRRRGR